MPNNTNAIIALLSVDSALSKDQIKEMQAALSEQGYTNNSERYTNPDGVMGPLTRSDMIDFIRDNPESLLTISPTMVQTLNDKGLGDELKKIVDDNPSIQETLASRAKDILNGQNIDALHGTPELKELQTKLTLLGEYNARIDGFSGKQSRSAASALNEQFAVAASPRPIARPDPELESEQQEPEANAQTTGDPQGDTSEAQSNAVKSADIDPEPESEPAFEQSSTMAYMKALQFDERGLQVGDGGERNWNDKRDPQVWNLQVLLNRDGADIAIDGNYGPGTARAVRAFQEEHDLPVTGQADFETLKTLASLPETQFTTQAQDDPKMYTIIEHHRIMEDIAQQVQSDTGISPEYLKAIRGIETHFGTDMKSGTGSQGPYQFTGRTFNLMINRHGEQIAQDLRGIGQDELADKVLASQAGNVDRTLRYDPYVSTYAAAFFTKENGINTMDNDNWGRAYAAHNIGLGGLNTVVANLNTSNVGAVLDRKYNPDPARNNPYFFRGGASGQTVLNRYQHEVESWHGRYDERVEPLLESIREMEAAQLTVQNVELSGGAVPTMTAGKPF